MNPKDRLIIIAALFSTLIAFSGVGLIMTQINQQRTELQLTANDDLMENMPPDIGILYTCLASFRGLFVDILWGRATVMKQEGKHYEAMKLADMITKLQPRFPKVWAFHAWNMSYNISVTTHTREERWMWVRAGIDLLREEGIPLNPNNVLLYKELGWIYLHKVGQFSDEMHWYYKEQLCDEWHNVLGEPPRESVEEIIAWFAPIADAYEAYINEKSLTRDIVAELESLIADESLAADETVRMDLQALAAMTLTRFRVKLDRLLERFEPGSETRKRFQTLSDLVDTALTESRIPATNRLLAAHPELGETLSQFRAAGLKLDKDTLAKINRVIALRESQDAKMMWVKLREDDKVYQFITDWLDNEEIAEQRNVFLSFLQAKVISEHFRMDPIWMLELMEGEWFVKDDEAPRPVPIDWRHPGAHGMYWASLGVRKSKGLVTAADFDVLNTDRQLLHSLQMLLHNGRIQYDPVSGYFRTLVDPRYIAAYDQAVFGAYDRIVKIKESERTDVGVAPETFKAGHENFLIWATTALYFYGDEPEAEKYLVRLRKLYGARESHSRERYAKTLKDFVMHEAIRTEALEDPDAARTAINGYITRAFDQGYALGDTDAANRYLELAKKVHDYYQDTHAGSSTKFEGVRLRMALPPYSDMELQAFVGYMLSRPATGLDSIYERLRVWRNAKPEWKLRSYDFIFPRLSPALKQMRLKPEVALSPPDGLDQYRAKMKAMSETERGLAPDKPFQPRFDRK